MTLRLGYTTATRRVHVGPGGNALVTRSSSTYGDTLKWPLPGALRQSPGRSVDADVLGEALVRS